MPGFPKEELKLIDLTIRWYTNPAFVANRPLLKKLIAKIEARNQKMLDDLGIEKGDLSSAAKFQALLEGEGIEIEYKAGKKGKQPCFAKTDEFMKRLIDHENETVADLQPQGWGLNQLANLLELNASTNMLREDDPCISHPITVPIPVVGLVQMELTFKTSDAAAKFATLLKPPKATKSSRAISRKSSAAEPRGSRGKTTCLTASDSNKMCIAASQRTRSATPSARRLSLSDSAASLLSLAADTGWVPKNASRKSAPRSAKGRSPSSRRAKKSAKS